MSTHFLHIIHDPNVKDVINQTTCQVVCDSFPLLQQGTSIASSYGVKNRNPMNLADMSTAETTVTTTKSTSKALAAGADNDGSDDGFLESCTRQRQKEKEIGKRREEIGHLQELAAIHGTCPSVPLKSARHAAAASTAA